MSEVLSTDLVVMGSGPGGYSAAFRAADLGLKVCLIEMDENLGGVCLNVGCIPSKALLHVAKVIDEAAFMGEHGVEFGTAQIDLKKLAGWKDSVIKRLTGGLGMIAKRRKVEVVRGRGHFLDAHTILVSHGDKQQKVQFKHAIIAVGSRPVQLPFLPKDDERIWDSTAALELRQIPKKMLVIGGGIIGLEMATVYQALGAEVTVVELQAQLMSGADADLVAPLAKRMQKKGLKVYLQTKVTAVKASTKHLEVEFSDKDGKSFSATFDVILSSVGRRPNGDQIEAKAAGIEVDARGFIPSDKQMRSNISHIYTIGDLRGEPMLAHKAVPEGRLAAEVIAGKKRFFDARCIASVAYTDPEIAWVGATETELKAQGKSYKKGVFPWLANGRSLANGRDEGLTKLLYDPDTHLVLGGGITGTAAGDLISELALAIEMGCEIGDLALTIHPHPTLSETIGLAAEICEGTITDL